MPEAEARVMRHRVVITQGTQTAPTTTPEAEKAGQVALATLEKMLPFLLLSDF